MIVLDANLLSYAFDRAANEHKRARAWLEDQLSNGSKVGLSWVTIVAFLRISTSRRYESRPINKSEAASIVSGWLNRESVTLVSPHRSSLVCAERSVIAIAGSWCLNHGCPLDRARY